MRRGPAFPFATFLAPAPFAADVEAPCAVGLDSPTASVAAKASRGCTSASDAVRSAKASAQSTDSPADSGSRHPASKQPNSNTAETGQIRWTPNMRLAFKKYRMCRLFLRYVLCQLENRRLSARFSRKTGITRRLCADCPIDRILSGQIQMRQLNTWPTAKSAVFGRPSPAPSFAGVQSSRGWRHFRGSGSPTFSMRMVESACKHAVGPCCWFCRLALPPWERRSCAILPDKRTGLRRRRRLQWQAPCVRTPSQKVSPALGKCGHILDGSRHSAQPTTSEQSLARMRADNTHFRTRFSGNPARYAPSINRSEHIAKRRGPIPRCA